VSVLTGAPIQDALRVSRAAKAIRPDLPVVWGGWHPSMFVRECLEEPSVDVTVQGQGEITFAEIIERLANDRSLEGCLGCAYRDAEGVVHVNAPRPLQDVNTLRPHDYSLIDVARYFELKGKRQLDYISSQGCRFRCAFCADPFVYQRQWSGFAPDRIGEEVEELWRRYQFDDLSFQDETYFTYGPRVEAVADEFLRRSLPITWAATMRADQCQRLPEKVFARCKESGLRRVLIGVESGSQEMIDRIAKDIKIEQVLLAAERCRRYDVAAIFPFIVGFPEEEENHVRATLDLAMRLRAMHPAFETPIFYFKPYPGSTITQQAVANGFALPCSLDEWSRFDFVGSAGPWVSASLKRRIERFKFYQRVAWNRSSVWLRPLQRLARWRCTGYRYGVPVEMVVSNWLRPPEQMS
jgi:anaerobic magnesium-protoporphyrin IX monomethyl ester cyclase